MNYLSPRPSHRDEIPYFVYLINKSLAGYLAGDIPFGMLARGIERFAGTTRNNYDGRFS